MTETVHNVECIAFTQLEIALRLYCEREDYYSVITLAGASEEIFANLVIEKCMEKVDHALSGSSDEHGRLKLELQEPFDKLTKHREELKKVTSEFPTRPEECWKKKDTASNLYKKLLKKLKKIEGKCEGLPNGRISDSLKQVFSDTKPVLDLFVADLIKIRGAMKRPTPAESVVRRRANWTRNLLKHWWPGQPKVVEFDAQEEAKDMLTRAIDNYYYLTGSRTAAMKRF